MSLNRLFRSTVVAAALTGGLGVASANVEIGGTAGVHAFSDTNELGVDDVANAPSERNSALFGARLGVFFSDLIGVEAEFGVIPSEARELVYDVYNVTYRAHLVAQFRAANPQAKLIPFVLFGGGGTQIVSTKGEDKGAQAIVKDTDVALYLGVGAKYRVDNGWGLRLDGRILLPPASNDDAGNAMAKPSDSFTADYELLLSVYKEFGRHKVDDDPDHDGIRGPADKCPTEPEDKDGFEDTNGCPDPDNDNDGLLDAADKCPNEAEDKDGFQDDDGCPDPDNDNDGILDPQDKCPTDPETKNGFQDEDGCPDEVPASLKVFTGVIQGVNFKVSEATLLPMSNKTLDKAIAVLKEYPDLKVEIQGHTDDQPLVATPGAKYQDNQSLSQARADAVMAYFVSKGIDAARLTAKGYADTVPQENPSGLTGAPLNAARAKNRRVEFKLVTP